MKDEGPDVDRQGIIYGRHAPEKQDEARRMRHSMTPAETVLWDRLRANRLDGLPFRRQQVIDGLIVDFYCHRAGLIVEADGPIHESQRERDENRDAILKRRGLLVLRFPNEDIQSSTDTVLRKILSVARERIEKLSTDNGK